MVTKTKQYGTKVPLEVAKRWEAYCVKHNKSSYELLRELIMDTLGIRIQKKVVIVQLSQRTKVGEKARSNEQEQNVDE